MKRLLLSLLLLLGLSAPALAQIECDQGLSENDLLNEFSDLAPPGSIVPRNVRNVICNLSGQTISGVVNDGTTDNCAAITAAIAAQADPVVLNFGAGTYASSCPIATAGKSVAIQGVGKTGTILKFTGGTDGIAPVIAGQNAVTIKDLSIWTTAPVVGNGIKIVYTPNGFHDRDIVHVNIRDVGIKGVNQLTQSWYACLNISEVQYAVLDSVDCLGMNGPGGTTSDNQADNTVTPYAMVWGGVASPTDMKWTNSVIQSVNYGLYVANSTAEGMQLINNTFLFVGTPIYWVASTANDGAPQLVAIGNTINAYASCITLTGTAEAFITKNLFYHNGNSTSDMICVNLSGVNSSSVYDNIFESFPAGTTPTMTGVSVGPAAGYPTPASYQINISENLFGSVSPHFQLGILLNAGTAQHFIGRNRFGPNVGVGITDNSSSGIGQQTAPGRHYLLLRLGGSQSILNGTPTLINWDTIQYETLGWNFISPATAITIPATQQMLAVKCTAGVEFSGSSSTGNRVVKMFHNGVLDVGMPVEQRAATSGSLTTNFALSSAIIQVVAGDTFSVQVAQDSGGPLIIDPASTWFSCEMME